MSGSSCARCPSRIFLSLFLITVLFSFSFAYAAPLKQLTNVHRIVAIGDIHGDSDKFLDLLAKAQLADKDENGNVRWAPTWKYRDAGGGTNYSITTTLVQMGDLTDRGEDDLNAMLIAFRLHEQIKNSTSGDDILLLLGNHELLNIEGHFHYVSYNHGGFASRHVRQKAFEGPFGNAIIEKFKMVDVIERTIFVHAGFADYTKLEDVETINKKMKMALREKKFSEPLLSSNGPVWTRKMIFDAMRHSCDNVRKILSFFDADRIVVGHTPQRSGHIEAYCDHTVYATDVGVSRWMYDNFAALEIVVLTYSDGNGETEKKTIVSEMNYKGNNYLNEKADTDDTYNDL